MLFLLSYPPKYIDTQFTTFFLKNSAASYPLNLLPLIMQETDFLEMRQRLMNKRSVAKSKRLNRITRAKMNPAERERANLLYEEKAKQRLIIHTRYEKRLRFIKRDIHQIWTSRFIGTDLHNVRLIIGTKNRLNSKLELVANANASSNMKE